MTSHKYTLVTVFFYFEYEMLSLQARSLQLYVSPDLIEKILLIDNSERALSVELKAKLLHEYGHLAGLVQFLRPGSIARVPYFDGWRTQQILKLMASSIVQTDRYLVLDAKNHLIAPLTLSSLEDDEGKPRIHLQSYESNPLRPHLERALQYYNLDSTRYIREFTSSVTPFVFYTDFVKGLISDVSRREKSPFEQAFLRRRLTEFFLYASYILGLGQDLDTLYAFDQAICPCVWEHLAIRSDVQRIIQQAQGGRSPFFAVHRLATTKLDRSSRRMIAEFWKSRKLFTETVDGELAIGMMASASEAFQRSLPQRRFLRNLQNIIRRTGWP